ncbi:MAG TPA: S46 family peptidase [Bacteroidetes bacterium]|nr:S46 family peptidase [Bacteroidota bacterium]
MKKTIHLKSLVAVFLLIFAAACASPQTVTRDVEPVMLPEIEMPSPVADLLPAYTPVEAGQFDNGRMWTFEYAPAKYFSSTYGFDANDAWFEKARLSSVRLPNCSGSFISPNGLVMTNHHCAREQISQVSMDGESLLDDGFYATTLADERKIEDYYVDQLIDIHDVTDKIFAKVDAASPEQRSDAREAAIAGLQESLQSEAGENITVQVVSLYNGGRYSAYFFRRYTDIRLVMAPELQIGYYGGDDDNFTYPRYNLDMSFYRVYDNDQPLQVDTFFPFSRTGVTEGDAVFMIGNPGNTSRQQTVAQLTYRGLYSDKFYHSLISRGIKGLEAYYEYDSADGDERGLRNFIFGLKNAEKFYGGQVLALQNPDLMGRRTDNEMKFIERIKADPELASIYLPIIEEIEELQYQKIDFAPMYYASLAISPNSRLSSAVLQRALFATLYGTYKSSGAPEEQIEPLKTTIIGIADKPAKMDQFQLEQRINLFIDILGEDHEIVKAILDGGTAASVAEHIVSNSALSKAEGVPAIFETDILASEDPALKFARIISSEVFESQQTYAELSNRESELASQLGRAWFAVYDTDLPPDATFSLRISDGIVSGYNYNGTKAPYYTTFYGMYDRSASHYNDSQWTLPARWEKPSITMDLSTPLNFVSTNDIIGGNSGSPLVNSALEVVGLAFDSNVEGMGSSDFILDSTKARSVNVDVRGMLEALRNVYKSDRLVNEILSAGNP